MRRGDRSGRPIAVNLRLNSTPSNLHFVPSRKREYISQVSDSSSSPGSGGVRTRGFIGGGPIANANYQPRLSDLGEITHLRFFLSSWFNHSLFINTSPVQRLLRVFDSCPVLRSHHYCENHHGGDSPMREVAIIGIGQTQLGELWDEGLRDLGAMRPIFSLISSTPWKRIPKSGNGISLSIISTPISLNRSFAM